MVSLPGASLTTGAPGAWRVSLLVLAISLAWICAWYGSTAAIMVSTWANSETFAHGFVVVPIVLWLVWRIRDHLALLQPSPDWRVLPVLAIVGFAWLAAKLGAVNVVAQVAFVAMLVLTVPTLLGVTVTRALLFPLGFLFFCVPIGEFLLPTLMEHTANFTVSALRVSGVPVYREGLQLVIPTGRWSVVEACSGVRYLIASLMVGTLFAYLNYRSAWRRWAFVGVSIVVPIIANWVRAYMIVMLGHLTNNRLAVGVDHIIYGWLFFGVVMVLMFWIGAKWREDSSPFVASRAPAVGASSVHERVSQPFGLWTTAAALMAMTLVWPIADLRAERSISTQPARIAIAPINGWTAATGTGGPAFEPRFVSPSATIHQQFEQGSSNVGLLVAFYRDQRFDRKLVGSDNKLVTSLDSVWNVLRVSRLDVPIEGRDHPVTLTELQSRDGSRLVAVQWYWIDGIITSNDAIAKAATAWSRLIGHGDDSAAIVVYSRAPTSVTAQTEILAFIHDAWPFVEAALDKSRADR